MYSAIFYLGGRVQQYEAGDYCSLKSPGQFRQIHREIELINASITEN